MNTGYIDNDLYELLTASQMKQGNNYGTGVIIYNPTTRAVLVGERTDTHNICTPGGKVEIGESPIQGVLRECLEESNLSLNSLKFLGYRAHTSDNGKNWVSFMFLSTDYSGEIQPQLSEIVSWEWVPVDTVMSLDLFPPTKKSFELAFELNAFNSVGECSEANTDGNGDTSDLLSIESLPPIISPAYKPEFDCCEYSYQATDSIFSSSSNAYPPSWD